MICRMDAGIIGWVVGRGVGGMGALLTDAGHLDDIHLSRLNVGGLN